MTTTAPPCPMSRQVAGFALHALEPDEELEVRAHLRRCAECTAALHRHDAGLAALARTVPALLPPPGLRARILRAARTGTPAPLHLAGTRRPSDAEAPPRARSRRRWPSVVAAAACVVAVGGLAGQAADLHRQRDAEVAQTLALGRIVTGLDAPGSTHATLTDGHGAPVAAVVNGVRARRVVVADLPTNDRAGSVYVLWGLGGAAGRAPVPLGTFDATSGRTDVTSLPPGGAFTRYAVSLEPGRVAPATPGHVVASGQVPGAGAPPAPAARLVTLSG
ncbi:anti-sigma factor [Pseudonocardia sp. RS11V-5]|uniref:anti-sigma factor n=1 Tax=Pseudonocardia terrae TaxID=2905831 RepID=UPI001E561CC0|nr:anti-sigma factor [Pseudonocardia terrae]MCE3553084.1 anti-sigma factor [Pseudonocardia terrae]